MHVTRVLRATRLLALVAVAAALAVVAAACGGGEEETTPAETPAATTEAPATEAPPPETSAPAETAATTGEAPSETSVTDYVAYVGGTPGPADPNLSPVVIGWVNQQGGPIEIGKTATEGARIAVKFLNEQAGGIGGHPVELQECFISQSEEEGQQCGQQFANDPNVVAIVMGAVAIGNESLFSAIAGEKPVIIGVSVNPADTTQPNAAIVFGDSQYILAPYATFARDVLGVESAALVFPEGGGLDSAAEGQTSAFEVAGIPIKKVSYPANASDLTVPLVAAGAQSADIVMPVINPNDCVKFQKAIEQLGIPEEKILASPICLTPSTIEGLGDFPTWIYAIASSLTIDPTDPAVPPYQEILTGQGEDKFIGDPWVNVAFGEILTLAKFLNALGPDNITSDGIIEQMHAFAGPLVLGSPAIQCGKYPEAPAVCNDHTQFYKYDGQGVFTKAGDWVPPPEGWTAPNR